MKTRLLLLCSAILYLAATANAQTNTISAAILKPATLTLPERVKKFYLVERTATGFDEASGLARLQAQIESTKRYVVSMAFIDSAYSASGDAVPALLDWKEVGRLTHHDTAALLIVLERFVITDDNQEFRTWRIYDHAAGNVIDGFDQHFTNARFTTQAIDQYAQRFLMHWEWVDRDYYKSGNGHMKAAKLYLDSGNWERAAELWKKVVADSLRDAKTAAKACYNMALYSELNNDITGAQQWLARSQRMGNVLAVYYARILRERNEEVDPLTVQLSYKQGQLPVPDLIYYVAHQKRPASQHNNLKRQETEEEARRRRANDPYK